ncbi:MAG TPA: DUF1573 domain-containing protein [Prolixibacteraceae bacterium]|nr:DUF1573 domain-containing protein [Prolixibacteraceae bacterium]
MKHILGTLLFVSFVIFLQAQPKIQFEKTVHDFGSIKEDEGLATTQFEFKNEGNQPLIISNVKATCGCTTPEWTREPVPPGKTGTIKVSYNPKNRPGAFTKNVNIYTNSQPAVTVLSIKGKVEPRELTIEEQYPRLMGNIRWKTNYLSLGSVLNTQIDTQSLDIYNPSEKAVKIGLYRIPEYMRVSFEPETLEPGKFGKMTVIYDASQRNAFGSVNDRIYLELDGERNNTYSVGVSATINEDFSHLTEEQKANSPKAVIDNKVFDFGTIKEGDKSDHAFKLSNTGKSDLLIRSVKASCGCTAVKHENLVKPGETTEIKVVFNSRGKRGRQNKSVVITTNDYQNPTIALRVMGTVDADR